MKSIKVTYIDTGRHGYVSIAKKDLQALGLVDKISHYSGLSLTRAYLEEDQDAALLFDRAKELQIEIITRNSYNLNFKTTHNYNPELFDWKPKKGDRVLVNEKDKYVIEKVVPTDGIYIANERGAKYRVPESAIFNYITKVL